MVTIRSCGATTSDAHSIYLVLKGKTVEDKDEIFLSDKTNLLKVGWKNNRQLDITYVKARIFKFTNFWYPPVSEGFRDEVYISERAEKEIGTGL